MLKNKTELSPIRGISGRNFAKIESESDNSNRCNVFILMRKRERRNEIVATQKDASKSSLRNQKGRTSNS
jgi:hypothetical protein